MAVLHVTNCCRFARMQEESLSGKVKTHERPWTKEEFQDRSAQVVTSVRRGYCGEFMNKWCLGWSLKENGKKLVMS